MGARCAITDGNLIERLCRSLAYHLVETEITLRFAEGETEEWVDEIAHAKALIAEAGYDLDEIYPPHERPIAEGMQ